MFEKVHETLNKVDANKAFISEYGEKLKQVKSSGNSIELMMELKEMGIESKIRKIENKILYDNARIEMFREVMPKALEVWNSYENKPYGEKTKARIKDKTDLNDFFTLPLPVNFYIMIILYKNGDVN